MQKNDFCNFFPQRNLNHKLKTQFTPIGKIYIIANEGVTFVTFNCICIFDIKFNVQPEQICVNNVTQFTDQVRDFHKCI